MDIFKDIIDSQIYALAIALYIFGIGIRKTKISNKYIPIIISIIGIIFVLLRMFATTDINSSKDLANLIFNSFIQGVLCAAVAVYADQIFKQIIRINEDEDNKDTHLISAISVFKNPTKALDEIEESKKKKSKKKKDKVSLDKEDIKSEDEEEIEMSQVDGPRIDNNDDDDYEGD